MIPYDTKNYRARNNNMLSAPVYLSVAIIMIVILLGYLSERDREEHVNRVQEAAANQCSR